MFARVGIRVEEPHLDELLEERLLDDLRDVPDAVFVDDVFVSEWMDGVKHSECSTE